MISMRSQGLVMLLFAGLAGCSSSTLDPLVGDYNAQLEAVQEASREVQRNIYRDYARSPGSWSNPEVVASSEREFDRVTDLLHLEVQKAIDVRKRIESDPGFESHYRYGKYLDDDKWARSRLDALKEPPFRYLEKKF